MNDYTASQCAEMYAQAHPCLSDSRKRRYQRIAAILQSTPDNPEAIEQAFRQGRSDNTAANMLCALRAATSWAARTGRIAKDPLEGHRASVRERYGTPIYLTPQERDAISSLELSGGLAENRDVFIFQCYVGCRVSDLRALTADNVIGDMLTYIPIKTRSHAAQAVSVPLHPVAMEIARKYAGGDRLLPCRCVQRYNEAIRRLMRLAGLDRPVWLIGSKGEAVVKPLWALGSSHMARRTFVGTLYGMVQDPSLISSMSGHAEGSTAFLRYRCVSDDLKRALIARL